MREFKWHIVDGNDNPLCWEYDGWESERAVEFGSKEKATEFMKMELKLLGRTLTSKVCKKEK